ncbi:C45 family autoproteolytic acyltransferase/hydolase [Paraburkholderia phenazinium]|uniref:Acyl-coenzyme A:6-aminopenicillanic acid acyl-transferase n=1 Tax=Paraburkholderia phenazinium TaxID=60549 RepID=A0A1G7W9T2_9BURK|nr:C45 family peptidase [Paraburkholderia phenazinium]SDG68681.1 Acyl-coenzyme A:6-aminopenicillanic acid acyl-transferase [Paraburkholderia phenazinium]
MSQIQQFPFISVSGKPYERGVQYGRAAAERVRLSASRYGQTLRNLGYSEASQMALIRSLEQAIGEFQPAYLEEMRGIAVGAEVPYEDIVMINARTEVLAKARAEKAMQAEDEDGCTGVLVLPSRSATGQLIHAQNWDWKADCVDTGVVLRVRNDDGPDFLTFVEAGGLARSGLNAAGVSITANYLESDRDYTQLGVPLSLLRRRVLEEPVFANALRVIATTPKSCSNNIMLGMAEGFGIDFECAPDEAFPIYPGDDQLIVHANHWVSPVARTKLRDTGCENSPDSYYRDWRVRQLLNATPKVDRNAVKAALFDAFGTPYSVCRPPRMGTRHTMSATVAMIVMHPGAGEMDVAPLPALNRIFTRYSLHHEPLPEAV